MAEDTGLDSVSKQILESISSRIKISDLEEKVDSSRATIWSRVDRLVEGGYVEEVRDSFPPTRWLELTPKGLDILAIEEAKLEAEWSQSEGSVSDLYQPTRIFNAMAHDTLLPPEGSGADRARQISLAAAGGITLGGYSVWLTLRRKGRLPTREEAQYAKWMRRLYVDSVDSSSVRNERTAEPILKSTWTLAKTFRDQNLHFDFGAAFDGKLNADIIGKLTTNWKGQFEEFYLKNGVRVELDSQSLLKVLSWYVLKRIAMGRQYFDLVGKDLLLVAAKELEVSRS